MGATDPILVRMKKQYYKILAFSFLNFLRTRRIYRMSEVATRGVPSEKVFVKECSGQYSVLI